MKLLEVCKNNLIEIIVLCSIVIGATSSVIITLYQIQIDSFKAKHEADLANLKNEYHIEINKIKLKNEHSNPKQTYQNLSSDIILQECQTEKNRLTNDYETKIKNLTIKLAKIKSETSPSDALLRECQTEKKNLKRNYEAQIENYKKVKSKDEINDDQVIKSTDNNGHLYDLESFMEKNISEDLKQRTKIIKK